MLMGFADMQLRREGLKTLSRLDLPLDAYLIFSDKFNFKNFLSGWFPSLLLPKNMYVCMYIDLIALLLNHL